MTNMMTNATAKPPLPSFTADTVLSQLNAAIALRGGPEMTYRAYADRMLRDFPHEVREIVIGAHKCFYVVPELELSSNIDPGDYRIRTVRKFTPKPNEVKPLCLIGCVLVDGGVPVTAFKGDTLSCKINVAQSGDLLMDLIPRGFLVCDDVAREVLAVAQRAQDAKETWGSAFNAAVASHAMHIRNQKGFIQ